MSSTTSEKLYPNPNSYQNVNLSDEIKHNKKMLSIKKNKFDKGPNSRK